VALFWIKNGGNRAGPVLLNGGMIVRAESGGNDDAVSDSGDYGLWQINQSNFAALGINYTTALFPDVSTRAAIRMSSNGYNWAAWCTAWADPRANCGHGLLRAVQQGSAAWGEFAVVHDDLARSGLDTGIGSYATAPPPPPPDTGATWSTIQGYVHATAPAQWHAIDQARRAVDSVTVALRRR